MRVLLISGAFPPMKCGVGDYTALLVSHLAASANVILGVLTSTDARLCPEPPEYFYPIIKLWNVVALSDVRRVIAEFRPDIVHLQYPSSFGCVFMPNLLPLFCAASNITMVQTWHEHPIYSQLINAIPADTLVVVEPHYPTAYRQLYRFAVRHKTTVCIPIGANVPKAELAPDELITLKARFNALKSRLLVYFGFATPIKGIESLIGAADPARDRLVFICNLDPTDVYQNTILRKIESPPWQGKCTVTGYLPAPEISRILASADAAVFPFTHGMTARNGSVLAARLQGTFVVTTHADRRGYDLFENTFYAAPGNLQQIREALDCYAGRRIDGEPAVATWQDIAVQHLKVYKNITEKKY